MAASHSTTYTHLHPNNPHEPNNPTKLTTGINKKEEEEKKEKIFDPKERRRRKRRRQRQMKDMHKYRNTLVTPL
jgi:hypothetical protein